MADSIKIGNLDISSFKVGSSDCKIYLGDTLLYPSTPPTPHDYSKDYLTFVALENGTFKFNGSSINYSLDDGSTWVSLASNTNSPTVNAGNKILWKLSGKTASSDNGVGTFSSTNRFNVEGNIMSLVYGDDFLSSTVTSNYQFKKLFYKCTTLENAENLVFPNTVLRKESCMYTFYGCSSLVLPPSAIYSNNTEKMGTQACHMMFKSCTSLIKSGTLYFNTLGVMGLIQMYNGCSLLSEITCLATNISEERCTENWVSGVAASGTFKKPSSMSSWTTGTSGIPNGWTVEDVPILQWVTFSNGDTIPSDLQIYGVKGIVDDLWRVFANYSDNILFQPDKGKYTIYIGGFITACYSENGITSNTSVEYTFSNVGCSDSYTVSSKTIANLSNDIQLLIYA